MKDKKPVKVASVMRSHYVVVDGKDTVAEALTRMKEADAAIAIVSKRNDDDAIGLVLLADIAKQVLARDRSPLRINVYEIMAKPVITVAPDMDIRYCARLFENFGLSSAPVVQDGDVIGVVSYTELVLEGLWPDELG
ncbi:MAG: CBS domain-containing protein [Gammaproteobacteria bacterium]|nr:CBS domain-containing protein [Gammaproteobacteria bacterium]MDH3767141.1 CBS domain-containing protein [Gammaproteobacteria bacterium]